MATIQPGSLVPRVYSSFRGVDFSNKEVNISRSPDALNMWKDYKELAKCVETRPAEELYLDTTSLSNSNVYGMYFYTYVDSLGTSRFVPVFHIGTKLYTYENRNLAQIYSGMKPSASNFFMYNNILFILDGLHYLEYNGTEVKEVEGTIPTMYNSTNFKLGGGKQKNSYNMLSDYLYIEGYSDGETTDLILPLTIDSSSVPTVYLIDERRTLTPTTDYTWANEYDTNGTLRGVIHLTSAIDEPETTGQDNVRIKIKHSMSGYREIITHCTIAETFDNGLFLSGNANYPNKVYFSELKDVRYFPDSYYLTEGLDNEPVNGLVAGNGALWSFKRSNGNNGTIFYHLPIDEVDAEGTTHRIYSNNSSNVAIGCDAKAINFNDDVVFFSNRGMEAIQTNDIDSEQLLAHRSSMVDSKMLSETNYDKMKLIEWEGYLLIIIDNKVYLADSRAMYTNETHNEYEFFYWELDNSVKSARVYENILFLGTANGIYTLTDTSSTREIDSYWTTPEDEFKAPQYSKTTNKKGCVSEIKGEEITISVKTDNGTFAEIGTYDNEKNYVVSRIKKKKWRTIQLKYSSDKPFGLYSGTLESYIGAYLKR